MEGVGTLSLSALPRPLEDTSNPDRRCGPPDSPPIVLLSADDGLPVLTDDGTFDTNGSLPLVHINWTSFSNEYFFITTSSMAVSNSTYHINATKVEVRQISSNDYDKDTSLPRNYMDSASGQAFNCTSLQSVTVCQPGKTYQWGFSSLLLFIFSIFTAVYGMVVLRLNLGIWWHTSIHKQTLHFSIYRDILDLATEIKAELGNAAEDMSAEQLDWRLHSKVGSVRLDKTDLSSYIEIEGPLSSASPDQSPREHTLVGLIKYWLTSKRRERLKSLCNDDKALVESTGGDTSVGDTDCGSPDE